MKTKPTPRIQRTYKFKTQQAQEKKSSQLSNYVHFKSEGDGTYFIHLQFIRRNGKIVYIKK